MKNIVERTLRAVIITTGILTMCAVLIVSATWIWQPDSDQLAIYQFDLNIFKTILASFLVAMLGILIPAYLTEAKQNFERLKESRAAYSQTKTGIDYLALRLCTANLAEAHELVHQVHYSKHQAVLYDELEDHIQKRFDGKIRVNDWDDMTYLKLRNTRILLKKHAHEWDGLKPQDRLNILREVLPDYDEVDKDNPPPKYVLSLPDV